jgi:hypothetical protein
MNSETAIAKAITPFMHGIFGGRNSFAVVAVIAAFLLLQQGLGAATRRGLPKTESIWSLMLSAIAAMYMLFVVAVSRIL